MGSVEVLDQVEAVKYYESIGLSAGSAGIFGWSYGGYLSSMCLVKAADIFSCAIAGAPVTSWDGYDTHYTERYMSTPLLNPNGYASSSVMSHASSLTPSSKLLLVHGSKRTC